MDNRVIHRYGHELWTLLTMRFSEEAITGFLRSEVPEIQIVGPDWLQAPYWETLSATSTAARPDWLALRAIIRRAPVPSPSPSAPADRMQCGSAVAVISARPFVDDDVPATRPIKAIAAALSESEFSWLPAARRETLHRVSRSGEPLALLHLDTHGVRVAAATSRLADARLAPRLVLENDRGADPVTLADVLDSIGGRPPHTVLLTSCDSDASGISAEDDMATQAFARGVDSVVMARRRLTADEVDIVAPAMHAAIAGGTPVGAALLAARCALARAASREHGTSRIGGFAWAAFTLHSASAGDQNPPLTSAVTAPARSSSSPELDLALTRSSHKTTISLVQVPLDGDPPVEKIAALTWWSARWAGDFAVEVHVPGTADEASEGLRHHENSGNRIRIHDWTALTEPELTVDPAWTPPAIPSASQPGVAVAGAFAGPVVLDVILVRCTPSRVAVDGPQRFDIARFPLGTVPDGRIDRSVGLMAADVAPSHARYDAVLGQIEQLAGEHREALWKGLLACSAGFIRRRGTSDTSEDASFRALEWFADRALSAGLAVRVEGGMWMLDAFHPELSGAIHQAASAHQDAMEPSWRDWSFRVDATAPDLAYDGAVPMLPDHHSLAGRVFEPEAMIGTVAAEVSACNFVAHGAINLANGRSCDAWHGDKPRDPRLAQALEHIATRRNEVEQRIDAYTPQRPPKYKVTSASGEAVDPDVAAALERSMVSLDTLRRDELAGLILDNGPHPGASVTQPRNVLASILFAELVTTTGPPPLERFHELADRLMRWPEDRGHVYLDAALPFERMLPDALVDELLGAGIAVYLGCPGDHAAGHIVEMATARARRQRAAGRMRTWQHDIDLAERFVRTSGWTTFSKHVDDLLDELLAADLTARHLKLTAALMREYANATPPTWLAMHRALALTLADRDEEALTILQSIDLESLTPRTRTIVRLRIAHCLLETSPEEARQHLHELRAEATDTVLAEGLWLMAMLPDADTTEEANRHTIELLRESANTPEGGSQAEQSAIALCWALMENGDDDEARELLARTSGTSISVVTQAALVRAVLLMRADPEAEREQHALESALWLCSDPVLRRLYRLMTTEGERDRIKEAALAAGEQVRSFSLYGSPSPPPHLKLDPMGLALARRAGFSVPAGFGDIHLSSEQEEAHLELAISTARSWMQFADDLWDRARFAEAEIYFDLARAVLEAHPTLARDPEASLLLSEVLYSLASLSRSQGRAEDAMSWARVVVHRLDGVAEPSNGQRELLGRTLDLIGNTYFDDAQYELALAYHARAVRVSSGAPADADLRETIEHVLRIPDANWRVIHSLTNLGNSLARLDRVEDYGLARNVALFHAARHPRLVEYARIPDTAFVLRRSLQPSRAMSRQTTSSARASSQSVQPWPTRPPSRRFGRVSHRGVRRFAVGARSLSAPSGSPTPPGWRDDVAAVRRRESR